MQSASSVAVDSKYRPPASHSRTAPGSRALVRHGLPNWRIGFHGRTPAALSSNHAELQ